MDPPPGYVRRTKLNYPLLIGGGLMLAVPYGVGLVYMNDQPGLGALGIPVAGPWVALGQRKFDCDVQLELDLNTDFEGTTDEATRCLVNEAEVIGVLAGLGVGQLIGTILFTVGIFDQKKSWLRADLATLGLHDVALEPAQQYQGLSLRGRF